jgi:hypothetical protein
VDYADEYIMQQTIAGMLDHPSVFMGGPSAQSILKAKLIVSLLLQGYDVKPRDEAQRYAETARTWLKPTDK